MPRKPKIDIVEKSKNPVKKPTSAPKRAKKAEIEAGNAENFYSISALSRKFKLDRATIISRLNKAAVKPASSRYNEKLYNLSDVELVLSKSPLDQAKLKKLDAEAELKELEVKKRTGEFASVAEFTEVVQKIFGALHKKVAVQFPSKVGARVHNAKSQSEAVQILKTELNDIFDDLRTNFKDYL